MSSRTGTAPPSAGSPDQQVTTGAGRYLLALYWLSLDFDDRIEIRHITERLGVQSSSATAMVSQLADEGFLDYRKYDGVRLTDLGVAVGENLAWRYCVIDRFFQVELDTSLADSTVYELGFQFPRAGIVTLQKRVDVPCTGACAGTPQQYEGCQLSSTVEG